MTGLSLWELCLGAVMLPLAVLPLGAVVERGLGVDLLGLERWILRALLGYPAFALLLFFLARAGLGAALLPISIGALILLARTRTPSARRSLEAGPPRWSLLVLALAAFILTLRFNRPFSPVEGGLAYAHSVDHSLHLSLYFELLRGLPPREWPIAGGVPFPAYHLLSFMPGYLLVSQGGISPLAAYHVLSPALRMLLLLGGLYLTVRLRAADVAAAAAVIPALFFVAHAFDLAFDGRFIVGPPPLYDFVRNEASGGGLLVWIIVACLIALHDRADTEEARASILRAASLVAGLSYGFKAQLFLLFGCAYALGLGLHLGVRRWRTWLGHMSILACAALVLFWFSRGPGTTPGVEWRPGLFAQMYVRPEMQVAGGAGRTALAALASLPALLDDLLTLGLAMFRVVAFSPLIPAFLLAGLPSFRRLALGDKIAILAFGVALIMGHGLSIVSVYRETSPFEFRQAVHGLALLGAIINVVALRAFLSRWSRQPGRVALWIFIALSLPAAPVLLQAGDDPVARSGIVISDDEQCALVYLQDHTPPDALVMTARPGPQRVNRHAVVAGFAGRRAVLEVFEGGVDRNNDRETDVKRFYQTPNPEVAHRILGRYGVDYVLESAGNPVSFDRSGLVTVYERGQYRISRVIGARRTGDDVPEVFRQRNGMACGNP